MIQGIPADLVSASNGGRPPLDLVLPEGWSFPSGLQHLLIVPDAWISYVPFDLVHTPTAPNVSLLELFDISYLPSAAMLRRPVMDRRVQWLWTREVVAFGDPVITGTSAETLQQMPYAGKRN